MKVFVKDILKDESGPLTFGFSICREKWTWTLAFVTVDPVRAWPTLAWPTLAWPTVTFPTFDSHPTCGALAVVTCGLTIEAHKYFDELGLRGAVITAAWAFLTTAARSCKALTRRALCPSGQAMDFTAAALGSMLQSPRARALGDWFVVLLAGVVAFGLFGVASWVNECVRALYAFLKPFFKLMPTWFGLLAVAWQFAPCWIKPILSSRLSRCRFFFCALPWVSKALAVLRVVQDLCNIGCQLACDAADAANSAAAVNGAAPRATPVAAPVIIILAPPLSRKLLPSDLAACMVSSEFATMLSARSGVAAARIDVAEEAPCTVVLGCDDSTTAVLDVDG
ncbi:hypothetical protein M885DRAFT_509579 [Pelagophyceae sp. CCMP2097]|nr:hypothetical protein M885DRAFT_509579 [Pelagophyceae sp. CCMP2097]